MIIHNHFQFPGTWPTFSPNVTEEQAEQIIVLAVESGINVFDLSEAHSGKIDLHHYYKVLNKILLVNWHFKHICL